MEAWTSDILAAYEEAKGNNYEEEQCYGKLYYWYKKRKVCCGNGN